MSGHNQRIELIDSITCKKCQTANNGYVVFQIKVKLLFTKGKAKGMSDLNEIDHEKTGCLVAWLAVFILK